MAIHILLSLDGCGFCRSDDMTGQFTLAALEEEQSPLYHTSYRRVSDLEQGVSSCKFSYMYKNVHHTSVHHAVIYKCTCTCTYISMINELLVCILLQPTDYYDDQVKQEEEIGNVCMVCTYSTCTVTCTVTCTHMLCLISICTHIVHVQ